MTEDIGRIVEEAAKRKEREIRWRPTEYLFDKQLDIFQSSSRYRCNSTGRRGGKSTVWAVCLVDEAMRYAESTPIFVTMTRQDSRDIIGPALSDLNHRFGLGMVENKATGDWTLPNGSRILPRGAGTMREINKHRGRKYPCAIVDEAQAFGDDLYYLIDEVLEPATADYHGWLGISGTPAVSPSGPFYEIDQGQHSQAWDHFHWTFFDNPHMPSPEDFIQKVMARRGWTEDHPAYRREYLGQWVEDQQGRAFHLEPRRDIVPRFDKNQVADFDYVMGIDVGYNDPFAFVILAQSRSLGQVYVVESYEESELTTMEALILAERYCGDYPISRIAIDTGGSGKLIAEDWKKLTTLPIEAAKKTNKASQVSVINGDFQAGKIKVCRDKNIKFIADLMRLEWDQDWIEKGKYFYRKGFADHLADAFQYAYNLCFHHSYDPLIDTYAEPHSTEWYDRKERAMEERQIRQVESPMGVLDLLDL